MGFEIVNVAVGLSLVYLLLASIASALRERIEAIFKSRASDLEQGIAMLVQDDKSRLTAKIYEHPLIKSLFSGEYDAARAKKFYLPSGLPSYIPAKNFAAALIDIASGGRTQPGGIPSPPLTLESLRASCASTITSEPVRKTLLLAIDQAQGDLSKAQANLETWYDASMERVSGWYRRRTQWIILAIALVLTVGLNVNTLTIVGRLSIDASLQQALAAKAAVQQSPGNAKIVGNEAWQTLGSMKLPIGWEMGWPGAKPDPLQADATAGWAWWWQMIVSPIVGWLLTALAVSMGAPFWFDTLNRLTSLRSTLKPDKPFEEPDTADKPAVLLSATVAPPAPVPQPESDAHEWATGNPQEGVI